MFERQHGTSESAISTVKAGLVQYPACDKLHLILAQLLLAQTPPAKKEAREALAIGVKKCPHSVPLWLMSSRLEEDMGVRIKARALLEKARSQNGKSEDLWLESVKVEERDGSGAAKGMLARGEISLLFPLEAGLTCFIQNSPADAAGVRSLALILRLAGAATNAQVSLSRRPQENEQLACRHRYRCSSVLGRAQGRESSRLVRPSRHCRRGLRRRLGMVVEVREESRNRGELLSPAPRSTYN